MLQAADLTVLKSQILQLQALCSAQDADAITQATQRLNAASEAFAALRMDASVTHALAGKNLDSLEI